MFKTHKRAKKNDASNIWEEKHFVFDRKDVLCCVVAAKRVFLICLFCGHLQRSDRLSIGDLRWIDNQWKTRGAQSRRGKRVTQIEREIRICRTWISVLSMLWCCPCCCCCCPLVVFLHWTHSRSAQKKQKSSTNLCKLLCMSWFFLAFFSSLIAATDIWKRQKSLNIGKEKHNLANRQKNAINIVLRSDEELSVKARTICRREQFSINHGIIHGQESRLWISQTLQIIQISKNEDEENKSLTWPLTFS